MGIPVGNGIDINAPKGPDHKMRVGASDCLYVDKDNIPSYWRYEGMPVWAKEGTVWKKYILALDLVTWTSDSGDTAMDDLTTHISYANPHDTMASDIMTDADITVQAELTAIKGDVADKAEQIDLTNHISVANPHDTMASDIMTDADITVQAELTAIKGDVADKAEQIDLTNHIGYANPHDTMASDIMTDADITVQAELTAIKGDIDGKPDTLSDITGAAAELDPDGNFSILKQLIFSASEVEPASPATLNFSDKNFMAVTVNGNLTVTNIVAGLAGPAYGIYIIVFKFTAAATITFDDSLYLSPIIGIADSSIFLIGHNYNGEPRFIKSTVFGLSCNYYFGASADATVLEAEVLSETEQTDPTADEIEVAFDYSTPAYPWLVAPIIFPFTLVKDSIGGFYDLTEVFNVTPITVSGVACYLYIYKFKTIVDTLTFKL